jgi:hypothetical protein
MGKTRVSSGDNEVEDVGDDDEGEQKAFNETSAIY